jgi:hypothetical protein
MEGQCGGHTVGFFLNMMEMSVRNYLASREGVESSEAVKLKRCGANKDVRSHIFNFGLLTAVAFNDVALLGLAVLLVQSRVHVNKSRINEIRGLIF